VKIATKSLSDYPWYLKPIFRHQRRAYGRVLESALLWARAPKVFLGFLVLYATLDRRSSALDPALRALVMAQVSRINACDFCVDLNTEILLRRGLPPSKVDALENWRDGDQFDENERLALAYAETITRSRGVEDSLMDRLKNRFGDDAVVELTALIAFQNMSNKFNTALDVPVQGICRRPGVSAGSLGTGPIVSGESK